MFYKWTFKAVPANSNVEALISTTFSTELSVLTIASVNLANFNLTVTLEAKNWLGASSTDSITTTVENLAFLTVHIVGGNNQSISRNKKVEIAAKTVGVCSSNSKISYKWSFVSTNAIFSFSETSISSKKPHPISSQ